MLSFRMDETNFSQGELDGIRIVTDAGLKVDFDEFTSDGNTLGLWHLHDGACQDEGTGLEDASGGNDLTNYGAVVCEDGYAFDGAGVRRRFRRPTGTGSAHFRMLGLGLGPGI